MKKAFTLAEVLITLTIIGVVAAMTIPTLSKNIKEREYLTASKRINSMVSNSLAFVETNYGIRRASDAEDFVKNYLSKYLKMSKICGYENHESCGFNTSTNGIHRIDEMRMTMPVKMEDLQTNLLSYSSGSGDLIETSKTLSDIDRRGYSFLTSNGYSMMLFYNPNCLGDSAYGHYAQDRVCVNIVWDMNGLADPNTVSKDIGFTTALYPQYTNVVTPVAYPTNTSANFYAASERCKAYAGEDYKVPTRNELASLYFNGALINQTSGAFWSSEFVSAELGWGQTFANGIRYHYSRSGGSNVRCVRR